MSCPSSNQNIEQPDNVPVDPVQVQEVPTEGNVPNVPLQSPEVHAMEPANANVQVDLEVQAMEPANANVQVDLEIQAMEPANANVQVDLEVQAMEPANANVQVDLEVQAMEPANANVQVDLEVQAMEPANANDQVGPEVRRNANRPRIQVVGSADANAPGVQPLCEAQNESSSGSSEGSFEEYLPDMVRTNLSLTSSSPATSSTLGSSQTPTLSTDMEERSSLIGTPSSEGSVESSGVTAMNDEQMMEINDRLPDESTQKSKVDSQSPKETPEGSACDAKEQKPIQLAQLKAALSKVPLLPPLSKPAALPDVRPPLRPPPRATSLPPIPGAAVGTTSLRMKSSVAVLPPVAGATGGQHPSSEKSRVLTKESSDSSLSTSTSESVQSESDSPKKPTHSTVEVVRRRDSSDGSKADESSMSSGSPEQHKKKTLHKKVMKEITGSTPTPKAIRGEMPPLSRADTLDDVETIRTDSAPFFSNPGLFALPSSPVRDRRAISEPADPPKKDPAMAPHQRRAFSEAKAHKLVPVAPSQSLDTSISWPYSDPVDPPTGVRSEPVKRVTEKVPTTLQAISEGHSPLPPEDEPSNVYSSCVPEILMADEYCSEVVAYAGDLSSSNSDLNPRRERPRRADREADRQMREFNEAIAEPQLVSSGRGTDSDLPTSTQSSENAPALAGYSAWLQPSPPTSLSDPSGEKSESSSGDQNFQMLQGWLVSGSQDQSGAGSSEVGKTSQEGMDTLFVISEKGESLSPSSVSGPLSPAEMEGTEDHPGKDDRLEPKEREDVEMIESEKDPKSRLVVNLKHDGSPRTPKRKREPKKSTDDSAKDPELLSPGEDSKKKYCSEFSRPVMAGQIARSSSTGSVKPEQVLKVDVESLKKLAGKRKKSPNPGAEEPARNPEDKSKDPEDEQKPSA